MKRKITRQQYASRPRAGLWILLFCIAVGGSACVPVINTCLQGMGGGNCDHVISDLQIDHPRFELSIAQPVTGGKDFWLVKGESINASWDSFALYEALPGTMCMAPAAAAPPACFRCDMIHFNAQECGSPAVIFANGTYLLTISAFPAFDSQAAPTILANLRTDVSRRTFNIVPTGNTTYRLSTTVQDRGTLVESKVFVLSDSMTLPVTYEIQPLMQLGVTDADFFSGTIPRTPDLEDNFSHDLKIVRARILKGKPDVDPMTGKLTVKDASVAKPSRLIFIPSYIPGDAVYPHDSRNCRADSSPDGNFVSTRCVTTLGDANPAFLKSLQAETLTWVAEFKPAEGGILPTFEPGERLFIEFIISVN